MRRHIWILFGLLTTLALAQACTCEPNKLMETAGKAVGDFVGFAEGDDRVIDPNRIDRKRDYTVRHWKEKFHNGRHRALVDVEVDPRIKTKALQKLLRDAIHDPLIQRSTSVVQVRAWPGTLQRLAAPMGIGIFARDGRGWDGNGVGFEQIYALIPDAQAVKARGLHPLSEKEYLVVLGVENMLKRKHPMLDAQTMTAERHDISLEVVQAACLRGAKLAQWMKAQAEIKRRKK
jgi:hypothetical protein